MAVGGGLALEASPLHAPTPVEESVSGQILKGEHLIGHCPANGLVGIGPHGSPHSTYPRLGGQDLGRHPDWLLQLQH